MRMVSGTPARSPRGLAPRSLLAEALEPRRLLAAQLFPGEGPVVGTAPRGLVAADVNGDGKVDLITANNGSNDISIAVGDGTGGFAVPIRILTTPTGTSGPVAIITGDFDNDGRPDLAVANGTGSSITVFRNTTATVGVAPSFTTSVVPFNGTPVAIAAGDFNLDGKLDFAVADATGALVELNTTPANGALSFSIRIVSALAKAPTAMIVADFDSDGKVDLAFAFDTAAPIAVIANTTTSSSPTFAAPISLSITGYGLASGDFNGDGKVDLVASNASASVAMALANASTGPGVIGFATAVALPGKVSRGMAVADLDGDGRLDLVAASGLVTVLHNDTVAGSPIAFSITGFDTGPSPISVVAVDVNGDGRPDLATANMNGTTSGGFISVLRNTSSARNGISFVTGQVFGSIDLYSRLIVSADFDGDGKPDLAQANEQGASDFRVLRNTTVGASAISFAAPIAFTPATNAQAMIAADLNTDGKIDLLIASNDGLIAFQNTSTVGNLSFMPVVLSTSIFPASLVAADFDGDGKTDIAAAVSLASSVTILPNTGSNGSLSFAAPVAVAASLPQHLAPADVDGDGKVDLVVTRSSGRCSVLRNTSTGAGVFSFVSTSLGVVGNSGSDFYSITAVDFDRDGKPDVAISGSSTIYLFRNVSSAGSVSFTQVSSSSMGQNVEELLTTDLDGDGRSDLVVVSPYAGLGLMRNTSAAAGSISFTASVVSAGSDTYAATVGDFDGDGRTDLAAVNRIGMARINAPSNQPSTITILRNQSPANAYAALAGGTLTLNGNVTVSQAAGQITVVTPAGTAQFAAASISGVVINGTAIVTSDLGAGAQRYNVTVSSSGAVTFNTSQHLAALTLDVSGTATLAGGGGKLLQTTALDLGPLAKLDLNDNDLIYDYTGAASPLADVRTLIRYGWAEGPWIGPGITSTAAKNSVGRTTGLGYMEVADYKAIYGASATFDGETIDSTAVLVKYTLYGDADFNRTVDFNDFLKLQNGFGGTNGSFAQGDFNYDGATDFNDFLMLQNNFNQTLPATVLTGGSKTPVVPPAAPVATASIAGVVFRDNNKNGKFDSGDGVGRGAVVYLDLDNDGVKDANEPSAVADGNGKFGFKNLAAGKYRVRQVLAKGTVDSTLVQYVTLARGQAVKNVVVGSRSN